MPLPKALLKYRSPQALTDVGSDFALSPSSSVCLTPTSARLLGQSQTG
jgi:hypothetical protein